MENAGNIFPRTQQHKERTDKLTNEEAVAKMTTTNETLVKVSNETDSLLREIEALKAQAAKDEVSPELEAAINAVSDRANAIDQLVPDVTQPEKA